MLAMLLLQYQCAQVHLPQHDISEDDTGWLSLDLNDA